MGKYPINKEFFPFSHFTPPVRNPRLSGFLGSLMRPPRWIWRDHEIEVTKRLIKSYDGAGIEILIIEPYGVEEPTACLVYYHGGAFFFGGAGYHYKLVRQYALATPCRVIFVQYRLAPKHPHPTPVEDCYSALRWTFENAEALNIDKDKIAVGGDSAGGALAAAVCLMSRDRKTKMPLFQLLVYPVTDRRMQTESCKKYTDTPMWNSRRNRAMWQGYVQDRGTSDIAYASPMEAESFAGLTDAYVEVAEFDCLHDEGVNYAMALADAGYRVELAEIKGTMHGFDFVLNAPTSREAVARRIEYMKMMFFDERQK